MIFVGGLVCLVTWFGGRALARSLLGVPGISLMSRRADESYFRTPRRRRLAFRLAGPLATYVVVVALCFLSLRANGDHISTTTVDVVPDGPGASAGMRSGDRIIAIGGVALGDDRWEEVPERVRAAGPGNALSFRVQREDGEHDLVVTPNADGKIKVVSRTKVLAKPVGKALAGAVAMPVTTLASVVRVQFRTLTGAERPEMLGPVAIVREVSKSDDRDGRQMALVLMVLALPAAGVWPLSPIVELLLTPRRRKFGDRR